MYLTQNIYTIDIDACECLESYFIVNTNGSWLWHRRLGYASMDIILNCQGMS